MPKLEPKAVQKELDQGKLWPVYWLYGHERMKARELLKRIRRAALGEGEGKDPAAPRLAGLNEDTFDGTETPVATILDAARSQALGGGPRFIVVCEAHALKGPELANGQVDELMGKPGTAAELPSICVFIAKDLDARKKFSKTLVEKAAVVSCEDVAEPDREAWIGYLAKRKGLSLGSAYLARLCAMDPWSLDIAEQELEKYELAGGETGGGDALLAGSGAVNGGDDFLAAFFARDLKGSLVAIESFADKPDESLPLLGLFAWNLRHLALVVAARERRGPAPRLNPYVAEKLQAWGRGWRLAEVVELQGLVEELDYNLKQRPFLPLGLWSSIALRFCR